MTIRNKFLKIYHNLFDLFHLFFLLFTVKKDSCGGVYSKNRFLWQSLHAPAQFMSPLVFSDLYINIFIYFLYMYWYACAIEISTRLRCIQTRGSIPLLFLWYIILLWSKVLYIYIYIHRLCRWYQNRIN